MARIALTKEQDSSELEISQVVPRDVYEVKIIEVEHMLTKKDSLSMYHFSVEIVDPEVILVDGVEKKISGIKFDLYAMLEKNIRTIKDLHEALELPMEWEQDEETNLPTEWDYVGMMFRAVLETREEPMLNAAKKPMKGRDGKPMMSYNRNFVRVA